MYYINDSKVKVFIASTLMVFLPLIGFAQYNYNNIPKELLTKEANVVVRKSHTKVEVISLTQINYSSTWAYTILNEQADDYFSSLYAYYDDFSKIEKAKDVLLKKFNPKRVEINFNSRCI